jgi:hypothetical protein
VLDTAEEVGQEINAEKMFMCHQRIQDGHAIELTNKCFENVAKDEIFGNN